jgi:hypothetical protein
VALPALALGHALISFLLLRLTLPLSMLHKVVGYPVLGWGGWWEDLGRYVALHLSVMMPLLGAAFLVNAVWRPRALNDLVAWMFGALALFWPLHAVVVQWAGTDNLVELMRGGGTWLASLALASALGWAAVCAGAFALMLVQDHQRRPLLSLAMLGLVLAPVFAAVGLQDQLYKYDAHFSAAQFLLSSGRDNYAVGAELAWRAMAAGAAFLGCTLALQLPLWRALAGQAEAPSPVLRSGRLRAP